MVRYSEHFLGTFTQLIYKTKDSFVASKCLNQAIKFINHSTRVRYLAMKLQPHMEELLHNYIVPITYLTQEDAELWRDDPVEYVRRQNEFHEAFYLPKNAAIDTIVALCSYKSDPDNASAKPDFLESFLAFCYHNVNQYTAMLAQNQ